MEQHIIAGCLMLLAVEPLGKIVTSCINWWNRRQAYLLHIKNLEGKES